MLRRMAPELKGRTKQRVARPATHQAKLRSSASLTRAQLYLYFSKRLGLPLNTVREIFRELGALMQREVRLKGEFEIPG